MRTSLLGLLLAATATLACDSRPRDSRPGDSRPGDSSTAHPTDAAHASATPDSTSSAHATATPLWRAELVDSVAYANEMTGGTLHRVRVLDSARVDTLRGVLTGETPMLLGDSAIVGIRQQDDRAVGLFYYDRRLHRIRNIAPPPEWMAYATPALSPDGRFVAYLAQNSEGRGYGAVAAVPSMRVVYRAAPVTMLETDAGVEHISWTDATHFEIMISLTVATGGEQRIRGTVTPLSVQVDTVK